MKVGSPTNLRLPTDHVCTDLVEALSFTTVSNGKLGNEIREPEDAAAYMYLFLLPENAGLITGKSDDLFHSFKGSASHL